MWPWGAAGAGRQGSGSFPFLDGTPGGQHRGALHLPLGGELGSSGTSDRETQESAAKIAARRWQPGWSLCLESLTKSNGAP